MYTHIHDTVSVGILYVAVIVITYSYAVHVKVSECV